MLREIFAVEVLLNTLCLAQTAIHEVTYGVADNASGELRLCFF